MLHYIFISSLEKYRPRFCWSTTIYVRDERHYGYILLKCVVYLGRTPRNLTQRVAFMDHKFCNSLLRTQIDSYTHYVLLAIRFVCSLFQLKILIKKKKQRFIEQNYFQKFGKRIDQDVCIYFCVADLQ